MDNQDLQLFTLQSFATLQGGALVAVLIPSVVGLFVTLPVKANLAVALVTAEVCSLIGAGVAGGDGNARWFIAVLNGLVIFSSAAGLNQAGSRLVHPSSGTNPPIVARGRDGSPRRPRQFLKSWW